MQSSSFKIISASAGSGKTFAVAKAYLKLILTSKNNDAFRNILAITFTNKAVGEMKERIIRSLSEFSSPSILELPHALLEALELETSMSRLEIHQRSKVLLNHILHNYGGFEISTIDGFVHRIIRTFALDLQLPQNFEVELDQDDMLSRTVNQFISEANPSNRFTSVLVDFALEKSNDDKSFDIALDLLKVAKLLVNENEWPHLGLLKDKSLTDFEQWQKVLKEDLTELKKEITFEAEAFISLLYSHQIEGKDLLKGLFSHFSKLASQNYEVNFNAAWQTKLLEGDNIYPKRLDEELKQTLDELQPIIANHFLKSKSSLLDYWLKQSIYKNLVPLSILAGLQTTLDQIKKEDNRVLISEFNSLIQNQVKNEPTPYIFERLGEKFYHYFIDEFQDTSKMQWENLVPLLDHGLSGTSRSTTLVGDGKQAIYRWRGGDVEQFSSLYEKVNQPFQVEAITETLEFNYRSSGTIVDFNNGLFTFLANTVFSNPNHKLIYERANQGVKVDAKGLVSLSFFNSTDTQEKDEEYAEAVISTIKKGIQRGLSYKDYCILVRRRKEGVTLANALSLADIPMTSSETLLIKNSEKVQFILGLLELNLRPDHEVLKANWLYELATLLDIELVHSFIKSHLTLSIEAILNNHFPKYRAQANQSIQSLPLYEQVEFYIQSLEFHHESDAFIQFFLDLVLEHSYKREGDAQTFLDYFEEHQDRLSIAVPEDRDAVSIMTIHKSKGLEFPVVLMPYADLKLHDDRNSHLWIRISEGENSGFSEAMVNVNKKMLDFKAPIPSLYESHLSALELDHINLLYVALTRAERELHIFCQEPKSTTGTPKSFPEIFAAYLDELNLWSNTQKEYTIGHPYQPLTQPTSDPLEVINFVETAIGQKQFQTVTNSGLLWVTGQNTAIERGILVHQLLAEIGTKDQLEYALNQFQQEGRITNSEREQLKSLLLKVINHELLSPYFLDDFDIYNERALISPDGDIVRPDRLCLSPDNKLGVIIDYKTGSPKASDRSQVLGYQYLLEQIKPYNFKSYLVYINEDIEVVKV